MDAQKIKRLGEIAGALGFLILALNLIDFFAGWNRIADETAIVGAILTLGGAYFALRK
ncbi:MAG: hypothetical protein NT051_01810 [Candidatus Micrarchaeota archaeon]|nr:hypothetical protein [Candidatus Micrarchaeota archaeon]